MNKEDGIRLQIKRLGLEQDDLSLMKALYEDHNLSVTMIAEKWDITEYLEQRSLLRLFKNIGVKMRPAGRQSKQKYPDESTY